MTKATSGNAWQGSLSDAELGAIVMRMCEGDQESLRVMRVLMGRLAARKVRPSPFGSTATPENLQSGIWLAACDGNNVDMRGAFKWLTSIPVGEVGENMSRAASSGKDKAQSSKVSSLSQNGDWDLSEILPSKEPGPEDIAAGNDLVLGMLVDFDWHRNGWKKWQTIVLAANGYTAKEGSYVFGVSQRTWYRWLDEIRTDFTEKVPQLGVTLRLRNNDMISRQPGS